MSTDPASASLRVTSESAAGIRPARKRAPAVEGLDGQKLAQAKADRVHAIRQARLFVNDPETLQRLFGEIATQFAGRNGGYTRIVKAGRRLGDNAPMSIIALVSEPVGAKAEAAAPTAG